MLHRSGAIGVVAVFVLGLVIAGCGGGGEDAISEQAFVKKADALCLESNGKTEAKLLKAFKKIESKNPSEKAMTAQEAVLVVPILIENAEVQADGIEALGSPSGKETEVETILKSSEAWVQKAKAKPNEIPTTNDLNDHTRELSGKYGLAKCEQTPFEVPPLES